MRAAVIERLGQSPVAGELPDPVQKNEGQLLVHLHAAALNAIDVLIAAGNHPVLKPVVPYVPGIEGVGTVVDGAPDRIGHRVRLRGGVASGTVAEFVLAEAANAVDVPDGLSDETAAAIGVVGVAAQLALGRAGIEKGESILVLGATGPLGQAFVGLARAAGASRILAAGRNRDRLEAIDADGHLVLGEGSLAQQLAQAGGPVDIVIDPLWGPYAAAAVGCLSARGRYVNVGSAAGAVAEISASALRAGERRLIGFALSSPTVTAEENATAYAQVAAQAARGLLPIATSTFKLADVDRAWQLQKSGPGGKVVVTLP
jgi:NADPH:quinone reductase-like Zn-dependent oxidoreductase